MADTTNKQTKVSLRHIGRLGDHLFLGSYLFDSRDLQLNVPTIMSSSMTDPGFRHLDLLQNYYKPVFISKYANELIFQPLVPPPWQLLGANTATTGKKLVLLKSPELNLAFIWFRIVRWSLSRFWPPLGPCSSFYIQTPTTLWRCNP